MDTMPVAPLTASSSRLFRDFSRWSGVIFVAFTVPAVALVSQTSPYTDSAKDYVAAYADGAGLAQLGRPLGMVALIAFLWALARLRVALPVERGGVPAAAIGPAGVIFAGAFAGALAAATAVSNAVETADGFGEGGFQVVPETAVLLDFVADGLFWTFMVAAAVLAWAIALVGRRTGVLTGWQAWVGFVLVPLLPFAWLFFMLPLVIFALWFAVLTAILPAPR